MRAAFNAQAIGCGSTSNSLTLTLAHTSGPSGLISRWLAISWGRSCTAEARRAEQAPHPDSMDLYFQGRACLNKGWNPERMTQARDFFERALAQDPNNIEALLGTSFVDCVRASSFFADERASLYAAVEVASKEALSLAPEHALAHLSLGAVLIATSRAHQGIAEVVRAVDNL